MAIIAINEIGGGSGGFSIQESGRYTRIFEAESDFAGDGPGTAIAATGLAIGDRYITINAQDQNAFVTSMNAQNGGREDPLLWTVTVEYGWYSVNEVGGGPEINPLLMPIDVSWEFKDYEHVVMMDIDGKPVLNSAGDPYDPPLIINVPNQIMTVVRNEATYSVPLAYLYRNSINSGSFAGQSAFFAKCFGITPKNVFNPNIGWYYQVTYQFEFMNPRNSADGKGFKKTELDRGLRIKDPKDATKLIHVVLNSVPITQPVLLDGTGKQLPIGGTAVFNDFRVFPELDFGEFDFDVAAIGGLRTGFP
jgi:hypothetical protein